MKIIYPANTTFPSPRANTIQILHTVRELAARGNEVHLVARQGSAGVPEVFEYYGVERHPNLKIHLVPPSRVLTNTKVHESLILKESMQLLLRFRGENNIVLSRDPLFTNLLLKMRKLFGFRVVYEAHTLFFATGKETYMPIAWSEGKEARLKRREGSVFRHADGIIFISSSLKAFAAEYFPAVKPTVVIHDGAVVPSDIPSKKRADLLCYSGQFYGWKGISILLNAMRWVNEATLRLYGGGYSTVKDDLHEMQKVIDAHSLSGKVEFCGYLPPVKIAKAISESSIGILPLPDSLIGNRCNSPLKLFDYLANGLAVVASDLSTVREIVDHGKNGHLVPAGDAEKLAEGINKVLSDSQYRGSLMKAGFETARNYSWEKRGIRLNEFLQQIT